MTTGQKNLYLGLNDVILQIKKMSSRTIVYNMFLHFLPFFGILLLKNHLLRIVLPLALSEPEPTLPFSLSLSEPTYLHLPTFLDF